MIVLFKKTKTCTQYNNALNSDLWVTRLYVKYNVIEPAIKVNKPTVLFWSLACSTLKNDVQGLVYGLLLFEWRN